jgi:hypothetical protein
MIAKSILTIHKGTMVVFLYPTPNCLKQSDLLLNIISGFKNTITLYKMIKRNMTMVNLFSIYI